MEYRREIDGLRAVAVIPVILFHAGFETFSGGFVGVDVFFVISGYLITTIILTEKAQGTFSLVNFYERRARRILPALYLVMLACLPFAWLWLRPGYLNDFSESLLAVSAFVSNIVFWMETGYFAAATETMPLLHTWSLAVEEQFYLLFPPFLMLLWVFQKRWIGWAIIAVGLSSLALAQWGSKNYPSATFYLLPTRAWELMVGASISYFVVFDKQQMRLFTGNKAIRELLGLFGFALIAYAIFAFDETVPFPSVHALVPTLGVALVILFATSETTLGRALGARVLAGVGLISYSAYLWHVPLFVFARIRSPTELGKPVYLMLSLAAIVLAYISWRFVERPFRRKGVVSRRTVFYFAALGSVVFIALGTLGYLANGFDSRKPTGKWLFSELEEKVRINYGLSEACNEGFTLSPACQTSDEPEILVWGDSYAMHLVQGILSSNPSAKIIQMTKSVCGPFFGVAPTDIKHQISWAKGCLAFTENVHHWLQSNNSVKYVVLSSPFSLYLSENSKLLIGEQLIDATHEIVLEEFLRTLAEIESLGARPVVFSPPPSPSNGANIGDCLVKASVQKISLDVCDFRTQDIAQYRKDAYAFLARVQEKYPVIWLNDLLCTNGLCYTHLGLIFIYRDKGHFSYEGSAEIGRSADFFEMITQIK